MKKKNNYNLSKYDVVFCESIEVLKAAVNMGLSTNAIVKSTSPALINSSPFNMKVISLGDTLASTEIISLVEKLPFLVAQVESCLKMDIKDDLIHVLVARQVRNILSYCHCSLLLDKSDFHEKRAILRYASNDNVLNSRLNPSWASLLKCNPIAKTFDIVPSSDDVQIVIEKSPHFIDRFKYKTNSEWMYKFWMAFWKYVPNTIAPRIILNSGNNPLLRETAAAMSGKGYALKKIVSKELKESSLAENEQDLIFNKVSRILNEFLINNAPLEAVSVIEEIFKTNLNKSLAQYSGAKAIWKDELSKPDYTHVKAIMVNTLIKPSDIGFYAAAKENDIPVISFQHGHGNEINKHQYLNEIMEEHFTSDVVVGFSDAYFNDRDLRGKNKVSSGVPLEYFRGEKYRSQKEEDSEELLYVSTALYGGHHLYPLGATYNDKKKYDFERKLIADVLSKLPHRVLYKKYLAQLFSENPSDLLEAEFSSSINFDNRNENLSFILPDHRVLITSRATSTLGWCLASEKPVIFINFSDHYPLIDSVENLLKEGGFLFNTNDDDFFSDLHVFLSQPIEKIEAEWNQKKSAREKLMKNIFGFYEKCAGKRAANEIEKILRKNNK